MNKIYIDDKPIHDGNASRGMGMYVRNLVQQVKEELPKNNLQFSQSKYDLIHVPYFDVYFNTLKSIGAGRKLVVTIPDLIPLIYRDHYPPGIRGKFNFFRQKRAIKKSDAIITISETSKKDIVRILGIDPQKVHVTYLAPNFKFRKIKKPKNKFNLPKQFVLYVGDVNFNKNLLTLCRAVKQANTKLVIVGKQAVSQDYDRKHIENQPLAALQEIYGDDPDIIRLGFLSNKDLNQVWNLASLYCQPSFYEGFGLPILEAMQASVPVVASKTQALVEVGADACEYFDPYSDKDLATKIELLLNDKKKVKTLVSNAKKRVRQFSWKKTADQTIDVYKKVLSS